MRKSAISPFVELIWDIIEDPSTDHIITWGPNGTSFCILDPSGFVENILSRFFRHGNISSFVRQLNMYNFHKNKNNTKDLEFYHKLFRRDAKEILVGIKRKPSEIDQSKGDDLLRVFLFRRYNQTLDTKSLSENSSECVKIEEENENSPPKSHNFSLFGVQQNEKVEGETYYDLQDKVGRKVLNIILVNKPW